MKGINFLRGWGFGDFIGGDLMLFIRLLNAWGGAGFGSQSRGVLMSFWVLSLGWFIEV
ncbi:hypothetical protein [Bartonella sp. MM55XZML]|uniref:hypothetical protein n=1 Tax=Bartonella sp. MM55XZML TaxID=3243552 RepID=UPI0035D07F19